MLKKMGWTEDKGLGKNEDGIVAAVKVKKREDGLGLGVTKDEAGNGGWSTTVNSFNAVLSLLNESYERPEIKKKSKKTLHVKVKYKKLQSAKDLGNKSSSDLSAVLGTAPSRSGDTSSTSVEDSTSVISSTSSSKDKKSKKRRKEDDGASEESESKSSKKSKKSKKKD